jgi:hypothetical protein
MSHSSIIAFPRPGYRFHLKDGSELRSYSSLEEPKTVILIVDSPRRLFKVSTDGQILELGSSKHAESESWMFTGLTTLDLSPVISPWEENQLRAEKPRHQILEELGDPCINSAGALVIKLTNEAYATPEHEIVRDRSEYDRITWNLENVVQWPNPPIIRVEISSGAEPGDIRRLIGKLEESLGDPLDHLTKSRGW